VTEVSASPSVGAPTSAATEASKRGRVEVGRGVVTW
jgi:hypothetical protein